MLIGQVLFLRWRRRASRKALQDDVLAAVLVSFFLQDARALLTIANVQRAALSLLSQVSPVARGLNAKGPLARGKDCGTGKFTMEKFCISLK